MSMTREQQSAIDARGEVLVSASAGAGKTTVMISRLADILEEGASLDNVLAVTFTKKAAAQMKEKLRSELIKRLNTEDEVKRGNLLRQLAKVNSADISTIHSFCARLIRTHFYALQTDASFEVLTEGAEASALRARAMDGLFADLYKEGDADLYTLLETLRKKRSDGALKELLYEAYDGVRQRPDYVALLDNACNNTYTEEGFAEVVAQLKGHIAQRCAVLKASAERFLEECAPVCAEGYCKILKEAIATLGDAGAGDIFAPPEKLYTSVKPRVKPETAEFDARFAAFCANLKKKFKSLYKDIGGEAEEREKFFKSGLIARAFVNVLKKFDAVYDGVKREEGKLDYGDLEHYALALLRGGESDGDVLGEIRSKYKFVFVDEYQDVNPIQDEILTAVGGSNIFCVGDLKQAIYGFRGSRSRFFCEKSAKADGRGKYIVLPDNFRSGSGVIDFVNRLFSRVMKPPVCEFDYADGHAMRGGARYPSGCEGNAEICLFPVGENSKRKAEGVYSVVGENAVVEGPPSEALAVLRLVREALQTDYYDPDEGAVKRVETGDICILTRKRANDSARAIMRVLATEYPVAGAAEVNICNRPEIARLINVLAYIENGNQDIPLAASLLSPLGNFTESELAKIRVYGSRNRASGSQPLFRECCKNYPLVLNDATAEKLNKFFETVARLRKVAQCLGAARLIDEVVRQNGYAAEFDTELKLAALQRLRREAYSQGGELYLSAFLQRLRSGGFKVLAPAALSSDCIKVMTMHASKGLEFPVVIVADIAAEFSGDDKNELPFDDDFGVAPRFFSPVNRVYRQTVLRKLYRFRALREELNNEINLFYVACTRAKYSLKVLTGRANEYDVSDAIFAKCYADLFDVKAFTPRLLPDERILSGQHGSVSRVLDSARYDADSFERLRTIAQFKYPFAEGVGLPVKSSASRIISLLGADENADELFDYDSDTNVESGLAYHRYLELCDFSVKDEGGLRGQLAAFEREGLLPSAQRKLLDVDKLSAILSMSVFCDLPKEGLYREREFICKLPSADYAAIQSGGSGVTVCEDDGNGVIVQGAIDLLVIRRSGGRITGADIIDYKYTAHSDGFVREKYAPQLALYKSVVCKIYGLNEASVTTTIINIHACTQIPV